MGCGEQLHSMAEKEALKKRKPKGGAVQSQRVEDTKNPHRPSWIQCIRYFWTFQYIYKPIKKPHDSLSL